MISLRLLLISQTILLLCPKYIATLSNYGMKRYGSQYEPLYYNMVRNPRYSVTHYPYQTYPDESYTEDEVLPMYYPKDYPKDVLPVYYSKDYKEIPVYYPKTSKFEVYQAMLPSYYPGRHMGYVPRYGYDPVDNIQEELIQEAEREQREEAQPIGHEIRYVNENSDYDQAKDDYSIDATRKAFLNNLMLSQLNGKQQADQDRDYYEASDYEDSNGKWGDIPAEPAYYEDDKDVEDLKKLVQKTKQNTMDDDVNNYAPNWFQNLKNQKPKTNLQIAKNLFTTEKRYKINKDKRENYENKFYTTSEKPVTETPENQEKTEVREQRGQKEIMMMRPATPVRNPFSSPVMEMMKNDDRKRTPNVYETIKRMLEMERSLENKPETEDLKPTMRKRIITSEESLTQQLSVLKKAQ